MPSPSSEASKERSRERSKQWRLDNPERSREIARKWNEKNRGTQAARMRAWREANPEKHWASHRRAKLKKYGLTLEQYEEMVEAQEGVCHLCGRVEKNASLHVDHDHQSGVVRKLLCGPCNKGLGMLGDDPDLLEKAVAYLREYQ